MAFVVAATITAAQAAHAVNLPDALIPQQQSTGSNDYLFARGMEVQFGSAARSTPQASENEPLEIVRSGRSGRDVVVSVDPPRQPSRSAATSKPAAKRPTAKTAAETTQPARRVVNRTSRSLTSALFPVRVSQNNPYGNIDDMRGLRPYNPGQKYDRQPDDRDSSFFGALFGR